LKSTAPFYMELVSKQFGIFWTQRIHEGSQRIAYSLNQIT